MFNFIIGPNPTDKIVIEAIKKIIEIVVAW